MTNVDLELLRDALIAALREDVGSGDITARSTIRSEQRGVARIAAKQILIVSGLPVAAEIIRLVDPSLEFKETTTDRAAVTPGTVLAEIRGPARSLLTAERTTLNLLQRMSGIATQARQYVDRIQGT